MSLVKRNRKVLSVENYVHKVKKHEINLFLELFVTLSNNMLNLFFFHHPDTFLGEGPLNLRQRVPLLILKNVQ